MSYLVLQLEDELNLTKFYIHYILSIHFLIFTFHDRFRVFRDRYIAGPRGLPIGALYHRLVYFMAMLLPLASAILISRLRQDLNPPGFKI